MRLIHSRRVGLAGTALGVSVLVGSALAVATANASGSTPTPTPTATTSASPTSTPTSGVPALTGGPTIDGAARVGNQVVCKVSYSDATDGTVAWLHNGKRIPGTNHETYRVAPANYPGRLTCATEAFNAAGVSTVSVSPPVTVVLGAALRPSAVPYITGTARVGKTFTAHHGQWSPVAGTYSYRWSRAGKPIPGATHERYTIKAADQGKTLSLNVTAHRAGYATGTVTVRSTKVAAAPVPPTVTAPVQTPPCTRTDSGTCIQGGEFCRDSDEGTYGYDANGRRYYCTNGHWEGPE